MATYSIQDIKNARAQAERLGLRGSALFCSLPILTVREACNGIGADWMPAFARAILNKRFFVLQTAAMIHDVRYEFGDGTDEDFHDANIDFYENGCILAKAGFSWWDPMRYIVMYDARRLAKVCERFGRKAYDEAQAKRKQA